MTPDFRILADSADITAAIRARLVSLSVTDEAGTDSDSAEITLDDRDGVIALPRTGAQLEIGMGYKESGVLTMGRYVVDEISLSSNPQTLRIRSRAADLRQGLKRPRTRPWEDVSVSDIVSTIAAEHGYEPKVAQALASEQIKHLDQLDESDLHFLTRLARERGAIAKPAGGMLLFVPPGEAKSASGKNLPAITLDRNEFTRWSVTIAERGKYLSVIARWHDPDTATEHSVTVGEGDPTYTIRRLYPDEATATSAARAQLDAFTRGVATLRATGPGNPTFVGESPLTISGVRSGVDGSWSVTRVTHRIDKGGYTCDIEAEIPKGGQ
jgi:hypothetical protein